MNPQELAYISRYGFSAMFFLIALFLLRSALSEFRGRIRLNLKPVKGFFLISETPDQGGQVLSYPLYHTTTIGKAASNDIRMKKEGVLRRHAVIYLFEQHWFIRSQNSKIPVEVNGYPVTEAVPLENQDEISLGGRKLIFVSERLASYSEGLNYVETDDLEEPGTDKGAGFPLFLINILFAGMAALIFYLMKDNFPGRAVSFIIAEGSFILLSLVIFFVFPLISRYSDRFIWVSASFLAQLGLIVQTRLLYVGWSAENISEEIRKSLDRDFFTMLIALGAGLFLCLLIMILSAKTNILEALGKISMVFVPLALLTLFFFGRGGESTGASLWIYIGPFSLQLTEFIKLAYLIVLAEFFKNRPQVKTQIFFAFWAGLVFFLIMLLPDLGTAMILLPTTLVVFFVMTSEYLKTGAILAGGTAVGALAYMTLPYIQRRISGWTSLWTEVNDQNRQIVFGLQAVARGGIIGRGLGNGAPESIYQYRDDMVFDALCEELGLICGAAVLIIFIVIWLRGTRSAMQVRDGFTSSLVLGIITALFMEAAVVIAGNTGILPLTGVTLPFIAAGGSSVIAKFMLIGMLSGLASRRD